MSIKEQKKSQIKQTRNRKYKTLIKNQFKKIENHLKEKERSIENLSNLVSETQKILDKASNKNVIHKNRAAKKKSNLLKSLNKLGKEKEVAKR